MDNKKICHCLRAKMVATYLSDMRNKCKVSNMINIGVKWSIRLRKVLFDKKILFPCKNYE